MGALTRESQTGLSMTAWRGFRILSAGIENRMDSLSLDTT